MDIDKIEKLAKEATQGNWTAFIGKHNVQAILLDGDPGTPIIEWVGFDSSEVTKREKKANAKYIAAVQPSEVLKLVDRIRELESA